MGGGTATIYGSAIVEGDFNGQGTPNVVYDSDVLSNLQQNLGQYARIPGSWHDF